MDNGLKERVEALERLVLSQQGVILKLHEAVRGHQEAVEAFAEVLGIKLEPVSAPSAPRSN